MSDEAREVRPLKFFKSQEEKDSDNLVQDFRPRPVPETAEGEAKAPTTAQ